MREYVKFCHTHVYFSVCVGCRCVFLEYRVVLCEVCMYHITHLFICYFKLSTVPWKEVISTPKTEEYLLHRRVSFNLCSEAIQVLVCMWGWLLIELHTLSHTYTYTPLETGTHVHTRRKITNISYIMVIACHFTYSYFTYIKEGGFGYCLLNWVNYVPSSDCHSHALVHHSGQGLLN